ncbi:MAG: LysR family transcriptional regulator [Gammaproteobacteria bacterium]|jgi:LysR family transcriptional regulator, cyn operon transcriptional activator|nr:LysR family transcriptional regulator [Gammaproteobacteria bacterium]MBU0773458.1 LysR family transcriptional regulator [Gammaproteobacteria bacterium]MBU0856669.1 LysR family transcriptional regulator [Gammaproteobacteria bacterium]MBU1846801.1 LysR family transcriptional regulator [Gammaproteobacteria bacterium]
MELRHLRYFVTLAECLNFTRAAERVHVTQSTLSHQIRQLEDELDKQLFERVGKRVMLTDAGELFLDYANQALGAVDQGIGALKESAEDLIGEVRVGATHTFNLGFIPECVATFLTRHPTARIVVEELSADGISAKVKSGELDLGIAYRPGTPDELWFEPLYNEEMVLVVSERHPLANRKRIRLVELHRQQLVLLPTEFATRAMLDECFRACGAEPQVVAEMNTIAPMLGLVGRTMVASIVAANAVTSRSGLKVVLLESPTPIRTPGILWRRGSKPQGAQMRSFSSIVRKLALSRSLKPQAPLAAG